VSADKRHRSDNDDDRSMMTEYTYCKMRWSLQPDPKVTSRQLLAPVTNIQI